MSITPRIERLRQNYINTKPAICIERARIYTESHKRTEGQPVAIRRARAFYDFCQEFAVEIFDDELVVGTAGKFRRSGILTPEFSWRWVDREMDQFDKRSQDPYEMTDDQRAYVREKIFPYWENQSLEEHFLAQIPEESRKLVIDSGIIDNDSKWRQAVGEITPDYQDILFKKGFAGILEEAKEHLQSLDIAKPEDMDKIIFYRSQILISEGIICLSKRYAQKARTLLEDEVDSDRRRDLETIATVCEHVPAEPPTTFHEAVQFVWFTQLGGIISENPLALNLGRFDQYMYPYYQEDIENNRISKESAQELVEALWLKLSEWVWTISANTAGFFAGYNQFQNLTVGGKTRDGFDATNDLSYICLAATESVRTHQPGLSVRIHADCPAQFLRAVTELVRTGTGFPAIHNDQAGTQMLLQAGYEPEDARDWNNCGCVVPHFRKTGEWTSAVNVNFSAALEYAMNEGKSRMTGEQMGLAEVPSNRFATYEQFQAAVIRQLDNLVRHSVIASVLAQKLHTEIVPRPFLSACVEDCLERGVDLSRGGAHYNVGPVLTGIGLAVTANSLAVVKKLVFEEKATTMEELNMALDANWQGYEALRGKVKAVPKYGNDDNYVDEIAVYLSNTYYRTTRGYRDLFGSPFNSAFMGISNYIPTGRVIGATPCGRKAGEPLSEGVSPYAGSDIESPLAAMRSSAKVNHDVHTGGTLMNLRLNEELLKTDRGLNNLGALIRSYFSLGAFHVQFNTVSNETLRKAQKEPEMYRDLLVRVAGYSTQFVNLSPEMQEAIIVRNTHSNL
ncbi:pyruvate formate-lyase/glycerol dehydratase family glycyl radical enzyme [Lachnospiraceae bacterium PM6-15]|uniref:glycyl radical protein n=1 Tax=Ohessyouella blattaphilus TaxID=2949333 RepID=UPI003E2D945C